MASPHTCTPDNGMETSLSGGEYFTIISQLMAEKDRLITEKDELVVSKDRLWREMYQMLQEKNGGTRDLSEQRLAANREQLENQRLRVEVSKLQRRNKELELALRDALDTDEDCGDGSVHDEGVAISAEGRFGALQRYETFDGDAGEMTRDAKLGTKGMDEDHHLLTPSSQEASLENSERIAVDSRPPVSVEVRPLVESNDANEQMYGRVAGLATPIFTSVMNAIGSFGSFDRFASLSRKGSRGCVERNLSSHTTFWTIEHPGHFACKTCFNKKQPCLRAVGDHQWILLPLPPAAREPDTDWQDQSYYIRSYEETSQRFPGTWRVEPHSKRDALRREKEAAVTYQGLSQVS